MNVKMLAKQIQTNYSDRFQSVEETELALKQFDEAVMADLNKNATPKAKVSLADIVAARGILKWGPLPTEVSMDFDDFLSYIAPKVSKFMSRQQQDTPDLRGMERDKALLNWIMEYAKRSKKELLHPPVDVADFRKVRIRLGLEYRRGLTNGTKRVNKPSEVLLSENTYSDVRYEDIPEVIKRRATDLATEKVKSLLPIVENARAAMLKAWPHIDEASYRAMFSNIPAEMERAVGEQLAKELFSSVMQIAEGRLKK